MGYKINFFTFVIIAGILGSILVIDSGFPASSPEWQGESHLEEDNGFRLEGILLSHSASPLKKCFSGLYLECLRPFFFLRMDFSFYLKGFFQSPPVKTFFDSILIHAP